MTPFYTRFPELAIRETRCVHVLEPGGPLPVGEYGFLELYCEEPGCDCRRVLIHVTTPQKTNTPLATINYGWESADYYTQWMHGDARAGQDCAGAVLDVFGPQSDYADHLLDVFQDIVRNDADYVARLARHYELFKSTLRKLKKTADLNDPHPLQKPYTPPMTVAEILRQLQRVPDQADFAPYEAALLAARKQREAITPELIAAIDRVSDDPAHFLKDTEDCLHLFAIYLLVEFRETRALDCFLRFFSLPGESALDLTGDMVTEQGAAVLASVCGGDPEPLLNLAGDEAVNVFVRSQAIDALGVQHVWRERSRAAVIEDLRRLFNTLAKPGDGFVWGSLICAICDFNAPELAPEARRAFSEGLVDETVVGPDSFDELLSPGTAKYPLPPGQTQFSLFSDRNQSIDAVHECSTWLCFRNEEDEIGSWEEKGMEDELLTGESDDEFAQAIAYGDKPYSAPPKVGRNDPCPCGSGMKYKKCCGKN